MRTPMAAESTLPDPYRVGTLWCMVVLAAIYITWLMMRGTITGHVLWDAVLGMLLGLYICSRPVGNALSLLFAQTSSRWPALMQRKGMSWIAMNLFVLLLGWLVVFLGATRLPRAEL